MSSDSPRLSSAVSSKKSFPNCPVATPRCSFTRTPFSPSPKPLASSSTTYRLRMFSLFFSSHSTFPICALAFLLIFPPDWIAVQMIYVKSQEGRFSTLKMSSMPLTKFNFLTLFPLSRHRLTVSRIFTLTHHQIVVVSSLYDIVI